MRLSYSVQQGIPRMTRFLLKLSLILLAAFAVFNVAARAFGTLQPPNPALAGFTEGCEGKPQPCWYGIVPGVTTEAEAISRLELRGFTLFKNTDFDDDHFLVNDYNINFPASIPQSCKVELLNTKKDHIVFSVT